MNAYIKIENAAEHRVQELFVQGQLIKADRVYTAAFVTAQGVPEKYGTNRKHSSIHAIEALQNYLAKHSPIDAKLRGSVIAV